MGNSGKVIFSIVFIGIVLVFLPKIFGIIGGATGGPSLTGSVTKTLAKSTEGRKGIIAISYNGGDDFEESQVHTGTQPQILVLDTYQRFYIAGTNNGLLVSRDGGLNWHQLSDLEKNIDTGTVIYDFAKGPGGALYMAAFKSNHGVLYVTNDNFFTVTNIWEELKIPVVSLISDNAYLYMGLDDGRLLRYSFSDETYEKMNTFPSGIQEISFIHGSLFVTLKNGGLYEDNGTRNKFTKVSTPGSGFFGSQSTQRLTSDIYNQSSLYITSQNGVYRSDSNGSAWSAINSILSSKAQVSSLSVSGGLIYLTSEAKFYKSEDSGKTWTVSEPMATNLKYGTIFTENAGRTVIVGTRK